MLRRAWFPGVRLYSVEVSGWDSSQDFFVERCELAWNEDAGKRVALARALHENTTLFVRLLEDSEADRSHPVVYEAELVGRTESGLHEFRLTAMAPKIRETESSAV